MAACHIKQATMDMKPLLTAPYLGFVPGNMIGGSVEGSYGSRGMRKGPGSNVLC